MYDIKQLHRTPGFVRLKMSDEVPLRLITTDLGDLRFGFLNFVLTKNADPRSDRSAHGLYGMSLTDSDKLDIAGVPTRARCGVLYPFRDRREIRTQIVLHIPDYIKRRRHS